MYTCCSLPMVRGVAPLVSGLLTDGQSGFSALQITSTSAFKSLAYAIHWLLQVYRASASSSSASSIARWFFSVPVTSSSSSCCS